MNKNDKQKQAYVAYNIKNKKLREWRQRFQKYIPSFLTDYLFHKNGIVDKMLILNENDEFVYDPIILENGIEMLFKVLENIKYDEINKARRSYTNFMDAKTRMEYLFAIIDNLDFYAVMDDVVISDLDEYAQTQTDPELLEIIENRKENVAHRGINEREKIRKNKLSQPY